MKICFFLLSITLIAQGCIKEIDLGNSNSVEGRIVVNSLFQPDSVMRIHIGITSGMSVPNQIADNAVITLLKDGAQLSQPAYIGNGWYNTFHYPEPGSNYKITVSIIGFNDVTAESDVPLFPQFIEPPYCKKVGNMVIEGDPKIVYNTHLKFLDIDNNDNHYEIFLGSLLFTIDEQTDPSLLMDSDLDIKNNIPSLIFSNTLFRNNQKALVINGLGSLFDSTADPLIPSPEPTPFPLYFHAVSKEYYDYRRSSNRHFHLQNTNTHLNDPITLLFIGNPVEMYTNVNGGYGIFAGFNANTFQVEYID